MFSARSLGALLFLTIGTGVLEAQMWNRPASPQGFMINLELITTNGFNTQHLYPVVYWDDDFSHQVFRDSSDRYKIGTGFGMGLKAGWGFTPWTSVYGGFSFSRHNANNGFNVADVFFFELGARLQLPLAGSRFIPYVVGTWGRRSFSMTDESTHGNTTYIYDSLDEGEAATSYGAGLQISFVDVRYLITPKKNDGLMGFKTRRLTVGATIWSGK